MKQEVVTLAAAWQCRRARLIEAGLPSSLPKVCDDDEDDTMMETGSDDSVPTSAPPVHSGYTMTEVQAHYNASMTDGQPASARPSVLERALEQHQLALGQIHGERASQETLAVMAVTNPYETKFP
ncbi:hypothetical protein D1007_28263 [Hordeum vulgare]|nr:hypothetical protein D1007_28263 [Hordeum vulgare]